ncbi:MAG: CDP-alcohol phosphatidyltransferase family protein [Actinomycetota bacterium]|nr:CDP-alcohol phosphatidyltransferase family protein [Actinomycetota bacterium]
MHAAKPEPSRAATNRLLLDLRAQRWRSTAWAQFVAAATARSVEQATVHRAALAQSTALHCLFLMMGQGARLRWVATSWTLTALHLGMLENRSHLGAANTLTLVRANLPVTGAPLGRWLGISALTTDFVDGKLARHTGTTTPFGRYADPLADTAFWTWFTFTDPGRGSRTVQTAVALTWLAPILSVTATSIARGQMIEPPRPRWIRPAVTLQILLATRALQRRHISPATRTPEDGCDP